jgi:hypothetical protein
MYEGKDGVYGGNVRIIIISEIYKVLVSIYFVPEGQISETPTFIVDAVGAEENKIKREV